MKWIVTVSSILALVLVSLLVSPAAAFMPPPGLQPLDSSPVAWLRVDNGPLIELSGWNQVGDLWELNFTEQASHYRVSGNITSSFANPYISYGVAFANNSTGLLPFALGIHSPMTLLTLDSYAYASYSGSGTDVTGNGFSITPNTPDQDGDGFPEIAVNTLNGVTNMGVDVGRAYSAGPGIPGQSHNLGTFSAGPQIVPVGGGPWDQLDTVLGFDLGGYQDIATINGFTSVSPVPEPASLAFLGIGLIGTFLVTRKRRR